MRIAKYSEFLDGIVGGGVVIPFLQQQLSTQFAQGSLV
jgi:hypothetical protein